MWPIIFGFMRTYAPYITLPVAAVIGFIGYNIEGVVSDRYTPYQGSIEQARADRLISENLSKDATDVGSLKNPRFVPRTIFEKNVSPSLLQENLSDEN